MELLQPQPCEPGASPASRGYIPPIQIGESVGSSSALFSELVSKTAKMTRPEVQAAIDACHPCTLETDDAYAADALAMELIHGRHDKREIVNMIRWALMGCPSENDEAERQAGR
jgi:hypothetical protein